MRRGVLVEVPMQRCPECRGPTRIQHSWHCPECRGPYPTGAEVCPSCGFEYRPIRRVIQAVAFGMLIGPLEPADRPEIESLPSFKRIRWEQSPEGSHVSAVPPQDALAWASRLQMPHLRWPRLRHGPGDAFRDERDAERHTVGLTWIRPQAHPGGRHGDNGVQQALGRALPRICDTNTWYAKHQALP